MYVTACVLGNTSCNVLIICRKSNVDVTLYSLVYYFDYVAVDTPVVDMPRVYSIVVDKPSLEF